MKTLIKWSFMAMFLSIGYISFSQIVISDDTYWENDTITLTENIIVKDKSTLFIDSGTVLLISEGVNMLIEGNIKALGSENSPIIFIGKDSLYWGGINFKRLSFELDTAILSYCRFYFSNQKNGGAIKITSGANIVVDNCQFLFNKAELGGAIYSDAGSDIQITNSLFAANSSSLGTIYFDGLYNVVLRNITVARNQSESIGGLYSTKTGLSISNSIYFDNDSLDFYCFTNELEGHLPVLPRFSIIGKGAILGNSNTNDDPQFVDPDNLDFSLKSSSPAIDHGCYCVLDPDHTRSDIGYEFHNKSDDPFLGYTIIDSTSNTNMEWSIENSPYVICDNLFIKPGETLKIHPGVKVLFPKPREITVYGKLITSGTSESRISFVGTDSTFWRVYDMKTQNGWSGFNLYNTDLKFEYVDFQGIGYNFYTVDNFQQTTHPGFFLENSRIELNNCTLKNNHSNSFLSDYKGLFTALNNSSVTIKNCRIIENSAEDILININNSNLELTKTFLLNNQGLKCIELGSNDQLTVVSFKMDSCVFKNNNFRNTLIFSHFPSNNTKTAITNNLINSNTGFIDLSGSINFINNWFTNNLGYLIFNFHNPVVQGNVVTYNRSLDNPIISFRAASPKFLNNTMAYNFSGKGYNFLLDYSSDYVIFNNIIYDNSPKNLYRDTDEIDGNFGSFKHNVVNEANDEHNFSYIPRFQSPGTDNFVLAANSPLINNAIETELPIADIMGNPRIDEYYSLLDIGAIEFQKELSLMTNIWLSDTTISFDQQAGSIISDLMVSNGVNVEDVTFSFVSELGLNNDYFRIKGNQLLLIRTPETEELLRIKIRAVDDKNGWLEKYFFLSHKETGEDPLKFIRSFDVPLIYPNPSSNFIMLDPFLEFTDFIIVNLAGQLLSFGKYSSLIDVSGFNPGTYLLIMNKSNNQFVEKFIIAR